jgi:hypothetical protein
VCDLINPITGQWAEDTIRNLFCAEDIKEILSIPIRHGMEDAVAWHLDKKRGVLGKVSL